MSACDANRRSHGTVRRGLRENAHLKPAGAGWCGAGERDLLRPGISEHRLKRAVPERAQSPGNGKVTVGSAEMLRARHSRSCRETLAHVSIAQVPVDTENHIRRGCTPLRMKSHGRTTGGICRIFSFVHCGMPRSVVCCTSRASMHWSVQQQGRTRSCHSSIRSFLSASLVKSASEFTDSLSMILYLCVSTVL